MESVTITPNKKPLSRPARHIDIGVLLNGFVFQKRARELFIDLVGYGVGRIFGREYIRAKNLINRLSIGDEVAVKIIGFDDGYGNYDLSIQDIQEIGKWDHVKDYLRSKKSFECVITEANKGGLITEIDGIKGFVPVSQLTPLHYPRVQNDDKALIFDSLKKLVGQKLTLRIIAADPASHKLILSERAAKNEIYSDALKEYKVGQVVGGRIVGLSAFGIFVRFKEEPPLEGLVHISELPDEARATLDGRKIGDLIQAKIIRIEDDRVNLTLRDLSEDPWISFISSHQVGQDVSGIITEKNQDIFAIVSVAGVKGITFENLNSLEVNKSYSFTIQELQPAERKLILANAR